MNWFKARGGAIPAHRFVTPANVATSGIGVATKERGF
jgi:hypothetical protein